MQKIFLLSMSASCWIVDIVHNLAPCIPCYLYHRQSFASCFLQAMSRFCNIWMLLLSSKLCSLSFLIHLLHLLRVEVKASTINLVFWCEVETQTEWMPDPETVTNYLGWTLQNLESSIFELGCFSFKTVYNSFKLHNSNQFCLWTFKLT